MRLLHDPAFLSATIGRVYDCARDPALWRPLLLDLAALLGSERTALGVMTLHGEFPISLAPGYEAPEVMERITRLSPLNPILPYGLIYPPDQAIVVSRDMGLETLKATRFYREHLALTGDLDAVGFVLTREGDSFGHWAIMTPDSRPPITEEEAAGLTLIAPHIRRAVEISRLLGAQRLEAETYRDALGQLDSPVLILDGARRVIFANPRAEAALAGGAVLRLAEGRLRGATQEVEAVLRRAAEAAASTGAAGFEAAVTGTDGEERLLFAVALARGGAAPLDAAKEAVMLVLRSPREDTRNPVGIAARVFNLTPAQVGVLTFLAQGHAPDDIADILGISVTTVRSHLSDLFGKTGTTRQAELVARTLSLASPLRA